MKELVAATNRHPCGARSPWLTAEGELVGIVHLLGQGSRPGQAPRESYRRWQDAHGQLRRPQLLAQALRVSPTGTLHIVGDFTLKLYPIPNSLGKKEGTAVAISHRVRNDNYGIWVTEDISAGAAAQVMTRSLSRMDAATIDAIDVTVVVCMLNAKQGQQQLPFEEMSGIGVHLIELCRQLQRHKRAAIFLGGKARLWRFDEACGIMVTKSILICRAHGVMCIDGFKFFKEM